MQKRVSKDTIAGFDLNFENSKEDDESVIVKRKEIEMKPMSEEEAILQMNLVGHEFFVFKNVETGNVDVLYRRKDGDYGIIETKQYKIKRALARFFYKKVLKFKP